MRTQPDEHHRFYDELADAHVQRDLEREPRPARRFAITLERQRNQARFADVLSSTATEYNARKDSSS